MGAMASQKTASRLFTQQFIRAQIEGNIKVPRHWPLCGEFTGDRWIPRTNGQQRRKCFHLMTSSCRLPARCPRLTLDRLPPYHYRCCTVLGLMGHSIQCYLRHTHDSTLFYVAMRIGTQFCLGNDFEEGNPDIEQCFAHPSSWYQRQIIFAVETMPWDSFKSMIW